MEKKDSKTTVKKKTTKKSVSKNVKETVKVVEKVKEEPIKVEEVVEPKKEEKNNKKIISIIFDIIFWILIVILAAIWITDFVKVKKGNEPMFCIKKIVHQFDDGEVKECKGLGYNVYNYNRTSKDLKTQFSPFFIGFEK